MIRQLPFGSLSIVNYIERELRKSRFNVSRCSSAITGANIAPVTLGFDEDIFLTNAYNRFTDRGITVRVILHGVTDHVRNFVETAIIHFFKRMHDASLHGLEAVFDARNSAFQNYIGSVIQKP